MLQDSNALHCGRFRRFGAGEGVPSGHARASRGLPVRRDPRDRFQPPASPRPRGCGTSERCVRKERQQVRLPGGGTGYTTRLLYSFFTVTVLFILGYYTIFKANNRVFLACVFEA